MAAHAKIWLLLALLLMPHSAQAVVHPEIQHMVQKLLPNDGASDNWFGVSVSLSGNKALVGAVPSFMYAAELREGAAYIFVRSENEWTQVPPNRIVPPDIQLGDNFGYSVSLAGNVALIGAPGDNNDTTYQCYGAGAAYVFVRNKFNNAWYQQAKLTSPDGAACDRFGFSVSLSSDGTIAAIGAPFNDEKGSGSGAAYVFHRNDDGTWSQEVKLTAIDAGEMNYFGYSVSVSGNRILIGAWGNPDSTTEATAAAGAAYVFSRNSADSSWNQEKKLSAPDGEPLDLFGYSVALDGDTAVIGAPGDDDKGNAAGAFYVFTRDAAGVWGNLRKRFAGDAEAGDRFGSSVSLAGDTALIGAYGDDEMGTDAGAAYKFVRNPSDIYPDTSNPDNTWGQKMKCTAPDGAPGDAFGWSVATAEEYSTCLAGAPWDDEQGSNSGSAHVFFDSIGGGRNENNAWLPATYLLLLLNKH